MLARYQLQLMRIDLASLAISLSEEVPEVDREKARKLFWAMEKDRFNDYDSVQTLLDKYRGYLK